MSLRRTNLDVDGHLYHNHGRFTPALERNYYSQFDMQSSQQQDQMMSIYSSKVRIANAIGLFR